MFENFADLRHPTALQGILNDTRELGFNMASDRQTGTMLAVLAASKPGGRLLELGTGTGLATAWMLHGMDARASLISVDSDERCLRIARRHLHSDPRVTFVHQEAAEFLRLPRQGPFDLVFADAWPGKFWDRDLAVQHLAPGGFYVIDDLAPQDHWPADHRQQVQQLLQQLRTQTELLLWPLDWSTGIVVGIKR